MLKEFHGSDGDILDDSDLPGLTHRVVSPHAIVRKGLNLLAPTQTTEPDVASFGSSSVELLDYSSAFARQAGGAILSQMMPQRA